MRRSLPSRRYAELIDGLGGDRGFRRGWMTDVAKKLGVHKSYVSLVRRDAGREVGACAIRKASAALGIDARHFFDAKHAAPLAAVREKQPGATTMTKPKEAKPGHEPSAIQVSLTPDVRALLDAEVNKRRAALLKAVAMEPRHLERAMTRSVVIASLIRGSLGGTR